MVGTPGSPPANRPRRLLAWTLAGLTVLGLAAALAWFVVVPVVWLDLAEKSLRQHDLAAARRRLDRYLAHWPRDKRGLLLAAQAARRDDDHAAAERLISACENEAEPTDASRLEWALLGVQQADFAGEEKRLLTEADHDPTIAPMILEALAKGYDASFRWGEALAVLQKLLDRAPGHAPGLMLRGTILARIRQMDEAERDCRRAAELAPDSPQIQVGLAALLERRGHTREAIYFYRQADRARPDDPATLLGLARALSDAAELDEAQQRLDELLALDKDHTEALVERGRVALRRNRSAEAEPFLARACRVSPWHREAHQLRLIALKNLERSDDAAESERRVRALVEEDGLAGPLKLRARDNPGDVGVRWRLWLWALRNGQTRDGIAWLSEILRTDPRNANAHAALADYFTQAGQPRRSGIHRGMAAAAQRGGPGEAR